MAVISSDRPWPFPPSLRLGLAARQPSKRPVPGGPLMLWLENALCSRMPPWASQAFSLPRCWATTCCRLPLHLCTAPLRWSCNLQLLLMLSLLSLGPSLLQFVSTVCYRESVPWSLNLLVRFYFFLFCLRFLDKNGFQFWAPLCNSVVISTAIPLSFLLQYSFLAVSQILNHFWYLCCAFWL